MGAIEVKVTRKVITVDEMEVTAPVSESPVHRVEASAARAGLPWVDKEQTGGRFIRGWYAPGPEVEVPPKVDIYV